jgi:hypothetical protein
MLDMKKLLIASAVSALFATPAIALAAGGPAAPTLDRVLEASGITSADTSTPVLARGPGHRERVIDPGVDSQNNSFALNQFGLMSPNSEAGAGGSQRHYGRDAQVINSFSAATSSSISPSLRSVRDRPFTVIAGKFATMQHRGDLEPEQHEHFRSSCSAPYPSPRRTQDRALNGQYRFMAGVNNGRTVDRANRTKRSGGCDAEPHQAADDQYLRHERQGAGAVPAGPSGNAASTPRFLASQRVDWVQAPWRNSGVPEPPAR